MLSLLINVKNGDLPKECLRVWTTGSQACEQTFRLLRSMTGTFSTIVSFAMKGILERINKLNYVASIECSEDIVFPRVKRRLLQQNEESEKTFDIPSTIEEIHNAIVESKSSAIDDAKKCSMILQQYDDTYLMLNTIEILVSEDDNNDVADEEVSANGASNPDCTENSSANQIAQKEYPRHANLQASHSKISYFLPIFCPF